MAGWLRGIPPTAVFVLSARADAAGDALQSGTGIRTVEAVAYVVGALILLSLGAVALRRYRNMAKLNRELRDALRVSGQREVEEIETVRRVQLLDQVNEAVVATDLEHRIVFWNRAAERLYGWSAEEAQGRELGTVIPAIMPDLQRDGIVQIMSRGDRGENVVCLTREGKEMTVNWSFSTVRDHNGSPVGLVAVVRDITEQKLAEEALKKSEERFNKVFRFTPQVIVLSSMKDGLYLDSNDRFFDITGYTRADVVGQTSIEMGLWARAEERNRVVKLLKEEGIVRDIELQFRCKDGSIREGLCSIVAVELEGEPCLLSQIVDISERKRAEDALRKSEERLNLVLEGSNDGFWDWNVTTGETYFSPGWGRILGYPRDEVEPDIQFMQRLIHPDDVASVERKLHNHLEGNSNRYISEHRMKTRSGEWKWVLTRGKVVACGGESEPVRMAGTLTDISNRRRIEEERERLGRELERKNKELESIIYAASHDLRSPLLNIQGFSKRLEKACGNLASIIETGGAVADLGAQTAPLLRETIPKALRFIDSGVRKMDALINGLLLLSRVGRAALRTEAIDMNEMIRSIVADMSLQIGSAAAAVHADELPSCMGDAVQLNQVFTNLLDNALKYADPERTLRISITGRISGEHSIYCVEDTGIGIAVEHQEKIWEVFHRLDPLGSVAGEGLGLTLVSRILDRNNGMIWVESEMGRGSRFYVALPKAA